MAKAHHHRDGQPPKHVSPPAPRVADRVVSGQWIESIRRLPRSAWPTEIVAGVTLMAIAVPEQIATAQLAVVPPFLALLAFLCATLVFATLGSNPIMSIGADSSIAPLFASGLVALAVAGSGQYLAVVSAVAIVTGLMLAGIGIARLGWVAEFLSAPIIAGFMTGIGVTIIVRQIPHALGIPAPHGSIVYDVVHDLSNLSETNGWTLLIAMTTLAIVVVGQRINPKLPSALAALVVAILAVKLGDLSSHGVSTLGTVHVIGPTWRLTSLSWGQFGVVVTTALTITIVIVSQSAATSRDSADDLGVDVNINRDFFATGVSNVVTGFVGAIPVNASPARTDVVRLAGGRSQFVGVLAGLSVLVVGLFSSAMAYIPQAALAGVLFYVAGRLIKIKDLRRIARVNYYELGLALITTAGVILLGVEVGVGVAVVLAVFDHTRRSVRPTSIVLGRRPGSTSWEPLGQDDAKPVKHVAVVLFGAPLYFANSSLFRSEIHDALKSQPDARHLVIHAAAMTDIDFTGLDTLAKLVADVRREGMDVVIARANPEILHALASSRLPELTSMAVYATVDEAVHAIRD